MTVPMRIEQIIPKGWMFYSADFSAQTHNLACKGRVSFKRDRDGTDKWHSLPPEAKNEVALFVNGEGPSLWDAINDACRQITKEDDIDALLNPEPDRYKIGDIFETTDTNEKFILAAVGVDINKSVMVSLISLHCGNRWKDPLSTHSFEKMTIEVSEFNSIFNNGGKTSKEFTKVLDAGKIV